MEEKNNTRDGYLESFGRTFNTAAQPAQGVGLTEADRVILSAAAAELERRGSRLHSNNISAILARQTATPASSATSGEAVDLTAMGLLKLWQISQEKATDQAPAFIQFARLLLAAHPAAEPDSAQQATHYRVSVNGEWFYGTKEKCQRERAEYEATMGNDAEHMEPEPCAPIGTTDITKQDDACQHCGSRRPLHDLDCPVAVAAQQGEDEPPLPYRWYSMDGKQHDTGRVVHADGGFLCTTGSPEDARVICDTLNHAHMMRKLGDGVSIDTQELRERLLNYKRAISLGATNNAIADIIAHIDAKLAQARAAGADIDKLRDDLAWHKESLKRHSSKLDSVWEGIRKAVQKYSGKPCDGEPFDRLDELLSSLTSAAGAERKYTQDEMERFGLHVRDAALERIAAGAERAVPEGWTIKRVDNGTIIVRKDDVGGCATRQGDPDVVLAVLWALANDLLAAPSPAAVKEGGAE